MSFNFKKRVSMFIVIFCAIIMLFVSLFFKVKGSDIVIEPEQEEIETGNQAEHKENKVEKPDVIERVEIVAVEEAEKEEIIDITGNDQEDPLEDYVKNPTENNIEDIADLVESKSVKNEPEVIITDDGNLVSLGEFKLTAYCSCELCCGQWAGSPTASGTIPTENRTIAVDTSVIPFGTKVVINGTVYVAEDTGGAIQGNRIDVYMPTHDSALMFGVRQAEVFVVKE